MLTTRTYVESERVGVGYHRFARANAESTLPLVARCVIASSVSAPRIACIFLRSNMIISKFNGRARVSRLARLARERNATATPRGSERRSVSDIVKRSRLPRERRRQRPRRNTATRCESRRARCCLSQRRGRARGASGRRVARVDAILYTIRQFLFSFPSGLCGVCVCVRRVSLSSIQSPTAASARLKKRLSTQSRTSGTLMILPQVHLRKPCYDFYFL